MRILITADLGCRAPWFEWLQAQADRFGLVVITGDLLDVFSRLPLPAQIAKASAFVTALARRAPVAVCSGNHDSVGETAVRSQGVIPLWVARLTSTDQLVADAQTRVVQGHLVVTALSYLATLEQKRRWMMEGVRVRSQTSLPWLVIHHHPPAVDEYIGHEEYTAGLLATEFRPELWGCGRLYGQRSAKGFAWFQRFGATSVLNAAQLTPAGQSSDSPFPAHVVVDLDAGSASWHRPDVEFASVLLPKETWPVRL